MSASELLYNPLVQIIALVILPMFLVAFVGRRWRVRVILGWFFLPLLAYVAIVIQEVLKMPAEAGRTLELAIMGLAILSPPVVIVWGIPSFIGILLGLALGRFIRPHPSAAIPLKKFAPAPVVETGNWPMIHVGTLSDRLVIGGYEVRCFKWWPCEPKKLSFVNPKSSHPLICELYEVGSAKDRVRFAVGEVSNGVWAFFSEAPYSLITDQDDLSPVGGWPQPVPDGFDPPPGRSTQRISPDRSIRVDIDSQEWSNSHWVNAPRVTDIAKDKVILDLWGSDCHAVTTFPHQQCVVLSVRRYQGGQTFTLTLDVGRGMYQLTSGPGLDIPSHTGQLSDLDALVARLETYDGPRNSPVAPQGSAPMAWRSGLLILAGALIAIGGIGYYNYKTDYSSNIIITPMPKFQ